jgi:hypothetical protein
MGIWRGVEEKERKACDRGGYKGREGRRNKGGGERQKRKVEEENMGGGMW